MIGEFDKIAEAPAVGNHKNFKMSVENTVDNINRNKITGKVDQF